MSTERSTLITTTVVEDDSGFTMVELCRITGATPEAVQAWVLEGALQPVGQGPHDWCFAGQALRRARLAARFARDLELNAAGVALALDLLDEIESLRSRLRRAGLAPD